ncbi:hypothetical protein G4378_11470 [Dorea longicatena]|uniref:DUF6320 domain-containing protein n=1 Tax=Dorea longicatena TaxID=88431 RepID=UPI0011113E4A|nr:DUF6320 domain-containing protein [Dorea longicatena]NSC50491.1 hypothetical protein [Dorea longicatena]NSC56768.1 hypothetical protein [Dorea longicatena]NSD09093.1 hypothetical protein [Dorea longicatena]NSD26543.1 hypothetical protein [Dorea longicatena]NSD41977.1 hypothetical protein [Dorea longicatena]
MFEQKRAYWRSLDNAAKLFSAASSPKDTRVFRFYCELKEEVKEEILQEALNQTIQKYPVFLSVMRKGLFWHYLEKSELRPVVREEYKEPCSSLYVRDKKTLLFEVTYYKKRINFEVFHALTDGTGATEFLRELVKNYLYLIHEEDLEPVELSNQYLTVKDQEDDSFSRYYDPDFPRKKKKKIRAVQIKKGGKGYEELQINEASMSVKELLGIAREKKVSMSVLLTAAFICAIHEEMSRMQEKKPVILMVPVNLRKIFPSDSMLNFFGYIEPGYQFGGGKDSFEDVLEAVKLYFQENLSKEHMAGRMNELIAIEKHKILKWAPLELKNRCIRAGAKMAEQEVTAVLSNMSVVKMPEDYAQYIEKFGVYTSTNRTELCICSFQDTLSLGFTSRYDSTNIQRNFYRILKELGASVKVAEPDFPEDARPNYEGKKVLQIFTFCCIAAIVISMMTDIIISPGVHWSVFVAAGCATMWLTMAVGYVKRFNLLKNAAWQLLIMSGICVLWDLGTGWRGWSVNIGIPDICLLIQVVMLIISRIRSLSPREYMIYYVMAAVYSMILPLILLVTGVIHYKTPSVICIGCSFLLLIGLILFKRKEFKEEMHKKFHVG